MSFEVPPTPVTLCLTPCASAAPHGVALRDHRSLPNHPSTPFLPKIAFSPLISQGKGVGGARKKLDAAILEDRDKPYACDSEWRRLACFPSS